MKNLFNDMRPMVIGQRPMVVLLFVLTAFAAKAQIGDYRSDLAIGVNGGYSLNDMRFLPKVTQKMHHGITFGGTIRYTCEKYFSTVCALQAEFNFNQLGWSENIIDYNENPVINETTGLPEEYQRNISYLQVPLLARLGWGREQKGLQFFIQAGPQFGYCLGEKTKMNFELDKRNKMDRVSQLIDQDTMAVQLKFDYGIAVGAGLEYSHPKVGHFILEARYYYGLGNIYHDSKRDNFGASNHRNIIIKATYLRDIFRTKKKTNPKS